MLLNKERILDLAKGKNTFSTGCHTTRIPVRRVVVKFNNACPDCGTLLDDSRHSEDVIRCNLSDIDTEGLPSCPHCGTGYLINPIVEIE